MKVLIVVDMQNDFVDGALGTPEAQNIVNNVATVIENHADRDTVILFTRDTHFENYMETAEGKNLPVPHCIEDTYGWEIHPDVWEAFERSRDKYSMIGDIYPVMSDHIIDKPTFGSTILQDILMAIDMTDGIEEIAFMGLCTGICVLSNVIITKATLPEVPIYVYEDCCACVTPESHKTAIEAMKLCQIYIA